MVAKRTRWHKMMEASKEEAILAVKLFNDPTGQRSLEGFVVHMHLAWLYLLQSEWTKKKQDYRIPDPDHKGWFKKLDGEYQTPPLAWFVKEKWDDQSAVRANIEFFIKLRNKIEHRHSGTNDSLATVVSGECHSLLLNYEEAVVALGGQTNSMATVLRFPIFVGGFTDKGKEALVKLTRQLPADLRTFLAEYDNSLNPAVSRDPKYCLRLSVVLEKGNRKGDMSMQFYNYDQLTEQEREILEKMAQKGVVINRSTVVPVSNADHFKAAEMKDKVAEEIPFKFNMFHFTQANKIGKVRPATGDPHPERTRTDFAVYDKPHNDYTYTTTYLRYLIKNCSTEEGFRKITGREPEPKPAAD